MAHAGVFQVLPQACYQGSLWLDFFRAPLIGTLDAAGVFRMWL